MEKSGSISSTFLNYSFLGFASVILTCGALFVLAAITVLGNIINATMSQSWAILTVIGIFCLIAMPYCFRIVRSMRFLDISSSEPRKMKFIIRAPAFANEIHNPGEIDIEQISSITRDRIFSNLMLFTIDYDGEQKTVTSFVKKENVNFIRNLPVYRSA